VPWQDRQRTPRSARAEAAAKAAATVTTPPTAT